MKLSNNTPSSSPNASTKLALSFICANLSIDIPSSNLDNDNHIHPYNYSTENV